MSLGRSSDGRLFTRDGRLCVGCCDTLGQCCSYPAFTSCNGTSYTAGSYGRRFRYNFNVIATVSATGRRLSRADCNGNSGGPNFVGGLDVTYTFQGSIDFAHSGPTTGGQCSQVSSNVSGQITAEYADGVLADQPIDLATYPELLIPVRPMSDRPITAVWPEFLKRRPVATDFLTQPVYAGFGVTDYDSIDPAQPYKGNDQGLGAASEAYGQCNLPSAPPWLRRFGSASAEVGDVGVWASNFDRNVQSGIYFNYTEDKTSDRCVDPNHPFPLDNCETVSGYVLGGPNKLELFGSTQPRCQGSVSYEEIQSGAFTSSGNITPTSSTYFGQYSGTLDSVLYRCCTDGRVIEREIELIDMNMTQFVTTSVQTLEPC